MGMRVRVRARGEGTEGDGRPGRRWRGGVCYLSRCFPVKR